MLPAAQDITSEVPSKPIFSPPQLHGAAARLSLQRVYEHLFHCCLPHHSSPVKAQEPITVLMILSRADKTGSLLGMFC